MKKSNLQHIIKRTRQDLVKQKQNIVILITIFLFSLLSVVIGYTKYQDNFTKINHYKTEVREQWEHRPAKHPHRMVHYGYLIFRVSHPLSIFDNGMDDYLGNVIFLEGHKQNSANLSEAGSSEVLVRFGSFNSAFVLQSIVPLILMFLGFGLISKERENVTLKILYIQGATGRDILWGKIIGLWQFSMLFILPILPFVFLSAVLTQTTDISEILIRVLFILLTYSIFYFSICTITVLISNFSKSSILSLVTLIGCWIFLAIILPKTVQFASQNIYNTPSRIAFEMDVENDVLKAGDSHNPDDPHFKKIKDSLLSLYKVSNVNDLPVNYSGIVMKEGEKISAEIYNNHQQKLINTYRSQQDFLNVFGYINPMITIKNLSMIASGSDFVSYMDFQKQAENFRYQMAQKLNDVQIRQISNIKPEKGSPALTVGSDTWKTIPDFKYKFSAFSDSLTRQLFSLLTLVFWSLLCVSLVNMSGDNLKFI